MDKEELFSLFLSLFLSVLDHRITVSLDRDPPIKHESATGSHGMPALVLVNDTAAAAPCNAVLSIPSHAAMREEGRREPQGGREGSRNATGKKVSEEAEF